MQNVAEHMASLPPESKGVLPLHPLGFGLQLCLPARQTPLPLDMESLVVSKQEGGVFSPCLSYSSSDGETSSFHRPFSASRLYET